MLSVVIPTFNSERTLVGVLSALVPGVVEGVVADVIVVDGGSADQTVAIADAAGTELIRASQGRGRQLATGAAAARGDWLLFLHPDTMLEAGWEREVRGFIERVEAGRRAPAAAAFSFALDDDGVMPRLLEFAVRLRGFLLALPSGDQGLLIPRALYEKAGGFKPLPLMEDVDLLRRMRRRQITVLKARAVTSGERYRHEGYLSRTLRDLCCRTLYFLRVPPRVLVRLHG